MNAMKTERLLALLFPVAACACASASPPVTAEPAEVLSQSQSALAETISCRRWRMTQCLTPGCTPVLVDESLDPDVHVRRLPDQRVPGHICKACATDVDCAPLGPTYYCEPTHKTCTLRGLLECIPWTGGQVQLEGSTPSSPVQGVVMSTPIFMTSAPPASVSLPATADTYVREGAPNQNQGALPSIRLQQAGSNRGLVRVDQPNIAITIGAVASATLSFTIVDNGDNWGPSGRAIAIHRLTRSFTESGATWNCPSDANTTNASPDCAGAWEMGKPHQPALHPWVETPTATAIVTTGQTDGITFDVTADEAFFFAHPEQNFGWIIKKVDENAPGRVELGSRESTSPPMLTVTSTTPNAIDPWGPNYTGTLPQLNYNGLGVPVPAPATVPGTVIDGRFTVSFGVGGRWYTGRNVPGSALHEYYDVHLTCSGSAPILPPL